MNVSFLFVGRLAALVVLFAACGDDLSLQVRVEHPGEGQIVRTVVTVYESPGDTLRCTDVEFQDVSETVLAGLEVSRFEENPMGTFGSIDGISRTARKVIVARGFRADGKYLTAGCEEKETIGGNDTVVVKTQIVAAVSIGGSPAEMMDNGIPIVITTPLGSALPKRAVSWRVYSAVGATPQTSPVTLDTGTDEWQPTAMTCTGMDGRSVLHPIPPGQISGFAARVRVSWGEETPRQFSAFTKAESMPKNLAPLATALGGPRICTTRVSGNVRRLVCLEDNDPGAGVEPVVRDLTVSVSGGTTSIQVSGSQMFQPGENIAGVYSLQNGAFRDAYAITSLGRVIGLFSPSKPPNAQQGSFLGEGVVEEVMPVPSCQPNDPPVLVVRTTQTSRQKLWVMHPLGGAHIALTNVFGMGVPDTAATDTVRLSSAGCVTELQLDAAMQTRQTFVIDTVIAGVPKTTAFYDCSNGKCTVQLPTLLSGAGFKRGEDSEEDRLVASTFDSTGTIVSELIFLDSRLIERTRISSASIPDRIVSGDFDGDAKTDLVWNFGGLLGGQNFQVAYARKIDGTPLSALTGQKNFVVDDMFTGDVTGDGFDDVVVVARSRDGTAPGQVSVMAVRAPAMPINARADDPCMP